MPLAESIFRAALLVTVDDNHSPLLSFKEDLPVLGAMTFNNGLINFDDALKGETLMPSSELLHHVSLQKKARSGRQATPLLSGAKAIAFQDGLFDALAEHFAADNRLAA
jgi:hypothetical protein